MNLFSYIDKGGAIMYALLIFNVVGLALMLWKFFIIVKVRKNTDSLVNEIQNSFENRASVSESVLIQLLKDEVQTRVHRYETGLNTVKIIASVSPLLGLLGTVLGILSAFKVISEQGLSDPSLFAGGISLALITTVGGLIVAIPHFIGHNYLVGMLDDLEIDLEKNVLKDYFGKKNV